MQLPTPGNTGKRAGSFVAAEDVARLVDNAGPLVEAAVGTTWYERPGETDRAALTLCRLRRASAGEGLATWRGDDAVRAVLEDSSHAALVWLASRAISYMDESGYPEAIETWFPEDALTIAAPEEQAER